ncbi:MAG TPA: BON domain-containing protein [Gemmatimonadaceae bacterium]
MSHERDCLLADEVKARVDHALHAPTESDDVYVVVKQARAVLKGRVHTWAEHEAVEAAARTTPGVTDVDNQLALLVKGRLASAR